MRVIRLSARALLTHLIFHVGKVDGHFEQRHTSINTSCLLILPHMFGFTSISAWVIDFVDI